MQISVILAHPDSQSFNHAIAAAAIEELNKNGHRVVFRNLYAEKLDPLLPAEEIPEDASLSLSRNRYLLLGTCRRRWYHRYSSQLVGAASGCS
jgi:putative NADPH-quinone reductase